MDELKQILFRVSLISALLLLGLVPRQISSLSVFSSPSQAPPTFRTHCLSVSFPLFLLFFPGIVGAWETDGNRERETPTTPPHTHTRDNNWSNSSDRSNTHTHTHTHTHTREILLIPFITHLQILKQKKEEEKGKGWLLSFWPNPIKIWEMRLEVVTLGWLALLIFFSIRFKNKMFSKLFFCISSLLKSE